VLHFILILSALLNLFFIWFIYRLLYRISDLVALIDDIRYRIDFFKSHLSRVYELETFYGDVTLANLLDHSRDLLEAFDEFNEQYDILQQEEIDDQLQEKI
jgi:type II secretory pathway component PulF